MAKTKVTLSLDDKLWMDFRVFCMKTKTSASKVIEDFIKTSFQAERLKKQHNKEKSK